MVWRPQVQKPPARPWLVVSVLAALWRWLAALNLWSLAKATRRPTAIRQQVDHASFLLPAAVGLTHLPSALTCRTRASHLDVHALEASKLQILMS